MAKRLILSVDSDDAVDAGGLHSGFVLEGVYSEDATVGGVVVSGGLSSTYVRSADACSDGDSYSHVPSMTVSVPTDDAFFRSELESHYVGCELAFPCNDTTDLSTVGVLRNKRAEVEDVMLSVLHSIEKPDRIPSNEQCRALKGYTLLRELGKGGFSRVLQAVRLDVNRVVALKVMLASGSSDEQFRRQVASREYFAADKRFVTPQRAGMQGDLRFLEFSLLKGASLKQVFSALRNSEEPLPLKFSIKLFRECLEILDAVHSQGLVHGDVSPGNFWKSAGSKKRGKGGIKMIDFGLLSQEGADVLRPGYIIGTPAYMSPQQASGNKPSRFSDLYSLFMMLYEMLSGVSPLHGITSRKEFLECRVKKPVSLNPLLEADVSIECMLFLQRNLALEVSQRMQTVDEIRDGIQHLLKNC